MEIVQARRYILRGAVIASDGRLQPTTRPSDSRNGPQRDFVRFLVDPSPWPFDTGPVVQRL